jgi:hypothetical protein
MKTGSSCVAEGCVRQAGSGRQGLRVQQYSGWLSPPSLYECNT